MSLISLIVVLCALGILMWAINTYLPMDPKFKTLLNIVVIVIVVLYLLQAFGILGPLDQIRVN